MHTPRFVHSFFHQRVLGLLYLLAVVTKAAMNVGVQIPIPVSSFTSFQYLPRSGLAGSSGTTTFDFLRLIALFSTAAPSFYIPTSNTRVPNFSVPLVLKMFKYDLLVTVRKQWALSNNYRFGTIDHLFKCVKLICFLISSNVLSAQCWFWGRAQIKQEHLVPFCTNITS